MTSPLRHKRSSPVKDSLSIAPRTRLLSPHQRGYSSNDASPAKDDLNPAPLKKQKLDANSSFITSSPQRPHSNSATPRKSVQRSLNSEFTEYQDSTKERTVVEAHIEITPPSDENKKESTNCNSSSSSLDISKSIITIFSPLFKTLFGAKVSEEEANKENLQENKIAPSSPEKASRSDSTSSIATELASDEVLPSSSDNSPNKTRDPFEYVEEDEEDTEVEETDDLDEEYDEEEDSEFDPYHFIANLPLLRTIQINRPAALPPKHESDKKLTLVLDLDETLVHCSTEPIASAEIVFPVVFNDTEYQVFVRKRPGFIEFLEAVSQKFEVVVFTASQEVYAKKLLELVDPERQYIHHQLYRDSCINVDGNFLKDLTILGRDLSKVIIVDNSPQTFGFQIENGIPIESWFEDNNDTELLNLLPFLESLHQEQDVRPHINSKYKIRERVNLLKSRNKKRNKL